MIDGWLRDELDEVRAGVLAAAPRLVEAARPAVAAAFRSSTEYQAMVGGVLRGEFGFSDPPRVVESVVAAAVAAVRFDVVAGDLVVSALDGDFADVLSADLASYESINRRGERSPVEWLRWLLFGGTGTVVATHRILRKGAFVGSRTGAAVMAPGGQYRVDAAYAGTAEANWVTRVADAAGPAFLAAVEGHLDAI